MAGLSSERWLVKIKAEKKQEYLLQHKVRNVADNQDFQEQKQLPSGADIQEPIGRICSFSQNLEENPLKGHVYLN